MCFLVVGFCRMAHIYINHSNEWSVSILRWAQVSPVHPALHTHWPLTASQLLWLWQTHVWEQLTPYRPAGHATHQTNTQGTDDRCARKRRNYNTQGTDDRCARKRRNYNTQGTDDRCARKRRNYNVLHTSARWSLFDLNIFSTFSGEEVSW